MTRVLREWQAEAVDAVRAQWAAGCNRTAVIAATGLGKSSVVGKLATDEARACGRVLLLAHREELLAQLADTCRIFAPDIPIGRVQASMDQRGFPITVASVATLRSERRQARMQPPSLVIVDECHRSRADGYMKILRWAGSFDGVRTLGVTATMTRGDKRGLGDVWQSVALQRDIIYGIEQGLLVPPRGRVVVAEAMDLGRARVSRGDYLDTELGELVSQSADEIVKAWCAHGEDRITVAFVPTVESAREMRDTFREHGVTAEMVTGSTPTGERQAMYRRLAAGATRVLVNVFVLVEGWDCSAVSCILMARPTRLPGVYTQAVGRALRLHAGKVDALVLDVCGASRGQSLITLPELHKSAEYDRSELDALPCEACGGFRARAVAADPDLNACSCVRVAGAGRDPDGGRARLQGPATYVDMPLLPDPKARFRWQRSRLGVPFLMGSLPQCRDRAGILWPDSGHADSPTWTPGHVAVRGPSSWVRLDAVPCSFEQARDAVQVWAGSSPRVPSGPAPEWLVGKAAALGVVDAGRLDRRALSAAVDVARVSLVVDR